MAITAKIVKELRDRTGAGMMECKKALVETDGDVDAAIEAMRKAGMAKADKRAGKVAAEGIVLIASADDGKTSAMVEVNSETDFVSKGDDFLGFAQAVTDKALAEEPADLDALLALPLDGKDSIQVSCQTLIAKLGENISVRRVTRADGDVVGTYSHGSPARIGVLVELKGGDIALARDIAMHVAASRPVCVSEDDVDPAMVEKEAEILRAQAAESGKPPEIVEKMIVGRLKKFLGEITLLGQPFVKDPDTTIGKLLKGAGAEVVRFERFEVGEGIEKKVENFADEVMAQVEGG